MKHTAVKTFALLFFLNCVQGVLPVALSFRKIPYVSISPTNGPLWIAKEAQSFYKA